MRKIFLPLFFTLFFLPLSIIAQINVNVINNGPQLAQIMSGPGVIISNVTLNCPSGAAGKFICNSCSLNMDSGIVLTNGKLSNILGPNNQANATYAWGLTPGDPDLANLIHKPTSDLFDDCILEFDITVQSDSVQFKYIFGSEEYPQFVCSPFNDVFAFFISGPGILGQKNIALIPSTITPVSINSVNPGTPGGFAQGGHCDSADQSLAYSQYYVNNGDGNTAPYSTNPYYIQYNGFTTTLTAAAGGLAACNTYHLKLAIADVGDPTYDSGVFIEANSLSSNLVSFDTAGTTVPGLDSAVRGCVDGIFTLKFRKPVSQTTIVNYIVGGTAANGVDYSTLPGMVQFSSGDSLKQIIIHPTGGATQTQSVELYLTSGCGTVYDSTLLYIVSPPQVVTGPDTTICAGDTVQLFATPGATTYSWSHAASLTNASIFNPLANPAASTTYVCTASLAGCASVDSVRVNVYTIPPFSVSAGPDIVACNNQPVQLNATVAGNPIPANPFTYRWAPLTGLLGSTTLSATDTSTTSNTYIIYVTSNRCFTTDTIKVTRDSLAETLSSVPAACSYSSTGRAFANITEGSAPYIFIWSSGAFTDTANALSSGHYHVTITDQLGCSATDSVTVYAPSPVIFGLPTTTPVSCVGGSNGTATVSASGGIGTITYTWSSGSNNATAQNLQAGTYTVTASDSNLCTATTSVAVSTLPAVIVTVSIINVSCFGSADGQAQASSSGGTSPYSYLWSNGATSNPINGLVQGAYTVTTTDNAGCTATAGNNIIQPNLMVLNETASNVTCSGGNNGNIILGVTGGTPSYTYLWNDGNQQQSRDNLAPGYYRVLVTDAHGCSDTISATISQPTPLVLTDSVTNATCFGASNGAIDLSVSGGTPPYAYSWSIGINGQHANNLPADIYYPSVTDNAGCMVSLTITVTGPPEIVFPAATVYNVSCFGGSNGVVQVYPSGGTGSYTYTWNGTFASNPDSSLSAGRYAVVVTDANNCTAVDSVTVGEPEPLTLSISGVNSLCYHGPDGRATDLALGGTPPYAYLWSNGQTGKIAAELIAGLYQSTVTDRAGCTAASTVSISSPGQILYSVDSTAVLCLGTATGTLSLHVSSGGVPPYTYAATQEPSIFITTTDSVIRGLVTGYYMVQVSDANGCLVEDSAFVPNAIPDTFGIITDSTTCYGDQYKDGAIHISGLVASNSPYQFSVDGGPFQYSGDLLGLAAGMHHISISNFNGCITDTSTLIGEPIQAAVDIFPVDTTLTLGENIQLFSTFYNYPPSAIVSYNWIPSMGLSCIDCPNPVVSSYDHINNYTLTITYNKGCFVSASSRIIVIGKPPVYIPNSFTPNGDGNNDLFLIYGESIKTVSLKVFNRWGEKVFDSENQLLGWDGNYKGQQQMAGVYVYEAQITFLDNTQTLRTGSITLIR